MASSAVLRSSWGQMSVSDVRGTRWTVTTLTWLHVVATALNGWASSIPSFLAILYRVELGILYTLEALFAEISFFLRASSALKNKGHNYHFYLFTMAPLTFAGPHQSMTWRMSPSLVSVSPSCLLAATAWWAECRTPQMRGTSSASWSWGTCDDGDMVTWHGMGTWAPPALSSCLSWCSFCCNVRRRGRGPGGRGWGSHSGRGTRGAPGGWRGGAGSPHPPHPPGGHCSPESPSMIILDFCEFRKNDRDIIALDQHLIVKELSVWKISSNLNGIISEKFLIFVQIFTAA